MKIKLRVHVIPVGDDPVGRIVKPAVDGKADKVYFLRFKGKDLFQDLFDLAKYEIVKKLSLKELDVVVIQCDFYDVAEIVRIHAGIIRDETQDGNDVFINVSTGGKIHSIAGMLSAMLFGGHPYFCKMDFETNEVPEKPDMIEFPNYVIPRPSPELIKFLFHVGKFMKAKRREKISKSECLDIAKEIDPSFNTTRKSSAIYNKLKFKYIDKLERDGFISVEPTSHGKISITHEGKFAEKIFSEYYSIS